MIDKDDPRLANGYCEELIGAVMTFVPEYHRYRDGWDHEHCRFCWTTIGEAEGELHSAYHDNEEPDRVNWLCEECFGELRDVFGLTVDKHVELLSCDFETATVQDTCFDGHCEICTARICGGDGYLHEFYRGNDEGGTQHALCVRCHEIICERDGR